jgi:acylphosphatase
MDEVRTVSVVIRGRVQGVSYRAWTRKTAEGLGLSGHVRNRADGAVEGVFSGPAPAVERMLGLCRKGPLLARVDEVAVTEGAPDPVPGGFVIGRDGS